ncbi:MAG: phage tail tube protein [Aminipila sp.]
MINQNRILSGANGNIWLNGKLLAQVKSIEAKITGNFEEVNFVGEYATYHAYTGWSGEGTLVLQKIDSTILNLVKDAYKTGEMPEIKIVSQLKDNATGKSERASISNVVITEFMLAKLENKALVEEELPFKFSDYEVIETI